MNLSFFFALLVQKWTIMGQQLRSAEIIAIMNIRISWHQVKGHIQKTVKWIYTSLPLPAVVFECKNQLLLLPVMSAEGFPFKYNTVYGACFSHVHSGNFLYFFCHSELIISLLFSALVDGFVCSWEKRMHGMQYKACALTNKPISWLLGFSSIFWLSFLLDLLFLHFCWPFFGQLYLTIGQLDKYSLLSSMLLWPRSWFVWPSLPLLSSPSSCVYHMLLFTLCYMDRPL